MARDEIRFDSGIRTFGIGAGEARVMSWRNGRDGRWFGAAVLIAVGIIGLGVNFDLIPRDILSQLWKLWPAIPLAIGLSILVRRQRYLDARDREQS